VAKSVSAINHNTHSFSHRLFYAQDNSCRGLEGQPNTKCFLNGLYKGWKGEERERERGEGTIATIIFASLLGRTTGVAWIRLILVVTKIQHNKQNKTM
jgi:hypothetical protein